MSAHPSESSGRSWTEARNSLAEADRAGELEPEDLELLATSAFMLGRDDEYLSCLERAHHAHLEAGEPLNAVRCAFWLGMHLALRREAGRAAGWFGRAQRLVDREELACVEQGYLLLPAMLRSAGSGDYAAAYATGADAVAIGERFGDVDLVALAVQEQGHARLKEGRIGEGLGLLDEAMVAVIAGELSPVVTGLIFCSVIDGCQEAYDLGRAQEWTAALTRWCEQQPDMVPYTGQCLVHRAELMQLHGAWPQALDEARRAGRRFAERREANQMSAAQAFYRQGEVHRLQGRHSDAEDAYRDARRCGWEPQPGLALLRLAQEETDAAAAAIRRMLGETTEPPARARLLPAYVEIMLAVGDAGAAGNGARELEEISVGYGGGMVVAMVAQARGAVALAAGDARAALVDLRRARQTWQELDAPYEAARTRVEIGLACRALGDEDTAALELEAARVALAELGAAPDVARLDALAGGAGTQPDAHGLSPRELQVLRLVGAGHTNKVIATELVVSERTVDRHVSNIFAKLGVSSRTAATAYAYEHGMV